MPPANVVLSANTKYAVVVTEPSGDKREFVWGFVPTVMPKTAAAGWSFGGGPRRKTTVTSWLAMPLFSTGRLYLKIEGAPVVSTSNNAPTVAVEIPDQAATAGTAFSYVFPVDAFNDADSDTLSYTVTKSDGTLLPVWLKFAADMRAFSGTPQAVDVGTVLVKVTASDVNGGSVSDTFDIVVGAAMVTPVVSIAGGMGVIEGASATFTLTANPAPASNITVDVTVTDSGAFAASGQTGSRTVTISGTGTGTLMVTTDDDGVDELDGTLTATVNTGSGYSVATGDGMGGSATVSVSDNEDAPSVTLLLSAASITEEGGVSTVTATLSNISSAETVVTVSAVALAPALAGDFTLNGTMLTIAAGATDSSGVVTITANGNTVDAPDKTVTVSGAAANGVGVTNPSSKTLTITDNESMPSVTLLLSAASITEEGGVSTVTATLSNISSAETVVTVSAVALAPALAGDFTLSGTNPTSSM